MFLKGAPERDRVQFCSVTVHFEATVEDARGPVGGWREPMLAAVVAEIEAGRESAHDDAAAIRSTCSESPQRAPSGSPSPPSRFPTDPSSPARARAPAAAQCTQCTQCNPVHSECTQCTAQGTVAIGLRALDSPNHLGCPPRGLQTVLPCRLGRVHRPRHALSAR